MATFLSDVGHEVHVVTAPPYYPQWRLKDGYRWWCYRREAWNGAQVTRCPLWVPRKPTGLKRILHLASFALSSLPATLAQAQWKPEVVIAVAPAILSAPNALLMARLSAATSWLHIQDFELDTARGLGMLPMNRALGRMMEALEASVLKRFDRLSAISPAMVVRAMNKGVPRARLELLPNWVDTHEIHPNGRQRALFGISDEKVVALYSGNLGQKQGLDSLLEVAGELGADFGIQVVICGDGALRSQIESQAATRLNVQYLPLQPEGRLNDLLNSADLHLLPELPGASDLVLPSKLGGMLASGKPVVASARAGSEIAKMLQGAGIVVAPGDIPAMAEAIRRLAGDPELRARLGRQGRKYAEQHLSKEAILGQFAAKLESFVGG